MWEWIWKNYNEQEWNNIRTYFSFSLIVLIVGNLKICVRTVLFLEGFLEIVLKFLLLFLFVRLYFSSLYDLWLEVVEVAAWQQHHHQQLLVVFGIYLLVVISSFLTIRRDETGTQTDRQKDRRTDRRTFAEYCVVIGDAAKIKRFKAILFCSN